MNAPGIQLPEACASRYQLLSELGSGGFGSVVLARDLELDRMVAIKLVNVQAVDEGTGLARFREEARATAALASPRIVKVFQFAHDGSRAWIVYEFLEGRNLREVLQGQGPLDPDHARTAVRQVAEALAVAHEGRVLHRDIKPENVLMIDASDHRVIDFGIARCASAARVATATGVLLGTPTYMAPELAEGEEATEASDLYSLGILWYELLTGHPPYTGNGAVEILSAHLLGELPAWPTDVAREVRAGAWPVLGRLLARRPSGRPASARALIKEIDGLAVSSRGGAAATTRVGSAQHPQVGAQTRVAQAPRRPWLWRQFAVAGLGLLAVTGFWGSRWAMGPSAAVNVPVQSTPAAVSTSPRSGGNETQVALLRTLERDLRALRSEMVTLLRDGATDGGVGRLSTRVELLAARLEELREVIWVGDSTPRWDYEARGIESRARLGLVALLWEECHLHGRQPFPLRVVSRTLTRWIESNRDVLLELMWVSMESRGHSPANSEPLDSLRAAMGKLVREKARKWGGHWACHALDAAERGGIPAMGARWFVGRTTPEQALTNCTDADHRITLNRLLAGALATRLGLMHAHAVAEARKRRAGPAVNKIAWAIQSTHAGEVAAKIDIDTASLDSSPKRHILAREVVALAELVRAWLPTLVRLVAPERALLDHHRLAFEAEHLAHDLVTVRADQELRRISEALHRWRLEIPRAHLTRRFGAWLCLFTCDCQDWSQDILMVNEIAFRSLARLPPPEWGSGVTCWASANVFALDVAKEVVTDRGLLGEVTALQAELKGHYWTSNAAQSLSSGKVMAVNARVADLLERLDKSKMLVRPGLLCGPRSAVRSVSATATPQAR